MEFGFLYIYIFKTGFKKTSRLRLLNGIIEQLTLEEAEEVKQEEVEIENRMTLTIF